MGNDGSISHRIIIKFWLQYSRMYFFKFCIPSKVKTWWYHGNVLSTVLKWPWSSQVVSCRQNINIYFKSERDLKSREIYSIFQSQRLLISGIVINLTQDPTNKMTSIIIFVIVNLGSKLRPINNCYLSHIVLYLCKSQYKSTIWNYGKDWIGNCSREWLGLMNCINIIIIIFKQ